jgi:fatty acid desaturase
MSVLGVPARGWKIKHDLHHRFGGVPGLDSDRDPSLQKYLAQRPLARWLSRTFYRHEFLFWWATPLSLWLTSWIFAVRLLRTSGGRHRSRTRWTLLDLAVSAAFFVAVGLYGFVFGWADLLICIALPFAVSGVVSAVCFVPNHRGMPPLTMEQARRPARYSYINSRTVLYPFFIPANYFMNYVPWQIEHHIFPTVAGYNLPALSPHLRNFARQERIPLAYEGAFKVMPSMLRKNWLWGDGDGKLYTFAQAEAICRQARPERDLAAAQSR